VYRSPDAFPRRRSHYRSSWSRLCQWRRFGYGPGQPGCQVQQGWLSSIYKQDLRYVWVLPPRDSHLTVKQSSAEMAACKKGWRPRLLRSQGKSKSLTFRVPALEHAYVATSSLEIWSYYTTTTRSPLTAQPPTPSPKTWRSASKRTGGMSYPWRTQTSEPCQLLPNLSDLTVTSTLSTGP
jgi:hypothetical protein